MFCFFKSFVQTYITLSWITCLMYPEFSFTFHILSSLSCPPIYITGIVASVLDIYLSIHLTENSAYSTSVINQSKRNINLSSDDSVCSSFPRAGNVLIVMSLSIATRSMLHQYVSESFSCLHLNPQRLYPGLISLTMHQYYH